ncbi:MAG: LysE family transporter [Chlorobiales bacterium]|nr:LysE family transporter [Chlorobiales bacterium]
MWSYLIWGVAYGFAAALQPGPLQSYLIAQTVRNGWRRTFPMVFAPLLSDGPIILLVVFALSQLPSWWLLVLRFVGGIFVLYLAVGTLQAWKNFNTEHETAKSIPQQDVFQAALVNVLSPAPYLFWGLVTGPLLITGWQETPLYGISLLVGFYVTVVLSLAGILLLCAGSGKLGPQVNRGLLGVSGLALVGFGVYQIWAGVTLLLQGL